MKVQGLYGFISLREVAVVLFVLLEGVTLKISDRTKVRLGIFHASRRERREVSFIAADRREFLCAYLTILVETLEEENY